MDTDRLPLRCTAAKPLRAAGGVFIERSTYTLYYIPLDLRTLAQGKVERCWLISCKHSFESNIRRCSRLDKGLLFLLFAHACAAGMWVRPLRDFNQEWV